MDHHKELSCLLLIVGLSALPAGAAAQDQPPGAAPSPAPAAGPTAPPVVPPPPTTQPAPAAQPPPAPAPAASSAGAPPVEGDPQPPPPRMYVETPPPPPLRPRTRHFHDGFYARFSLGPSLLHVSSKADGVDASASYDGAGWALDILLGGTPSPGLVIGGGVLLQEAINPDLDRSGDVELSTGAADDSVTLFLIGPMIDVFPDPDGGFHFGGLIGPASVGIRDDNDNASNGLGISAWAGYGWWVSSQFSVGAKIRLAAARSGRELPANGESVDTVENTRAITLMFSASYH